MKTTTILALLTLPASAVVNIDYVTVGNAGNAADPATGSLYGAVAYEYKIAKNETTIAQYAEFLNAVAATDTYALYHNSMAVQDISRSGVSGSYTYSVLGNGNRPIGYVSWFDSARFVNWMHNGQISSSTEIGVYNLNGATSGIFTPQVGATVWLPTEDEWYKAAYYDPTRNAGAGGYWLYPTQSDAMTSSDITVAGAANFIGLGGRLHVGAYGEDSESYYGTNDQGGNVWEWNDAIISGSSRGLRGGAWAPDFGSFYNQSLRSSFRLGFITPEYQELNMGFRLATAIPEPTTALLAILGIFPLLSRRRM